MVQSNYSITSIADVDKPGVRIVTKARSAYDLWLTENIKHASIIRTKNIQESFQEFKDQGYEVLSGLRPKLIEESERLPGSRILPGSYQI